jgi:hypothetical protein
MYSILFVVLFLINFTNGLVVPWDKGQYVCEKWDRSRYAHSPIDPKWRFRLKYNGDLVLRNESAGLLITNETDCINQCDMNEKCVAISFREDNRCIMMTQCLLTNKRSDYRYYYKKGFNNGENYTVSFGATCDSPYPPLIAHIRPATVPKCWEECMRVNGCNYAEIDETLECKLYSECEIRLDDVWYLRRGMVISNSTIKEPSPTMSPTPEPTPLTNMSTSAPTISKAPTSSPTHLRSSSAPTKSPTKNTGTRPPSSETSPTNPPTTDISNNGDNGRALSDGAIIGITIGVLILILLIVLLIVYFTKN